MLAVGGAGAEVAVGFSGCADGSAVEDEAVAEVVGFVWWQNLAEFGFDFGGVFRIDEAHAVGDADAVGVYDDAAGGFVDIA